MDDSRQSDAAACAELIEYVCGENEKDRSHITGKLGDGAVSIPATVLAKYVGTYRFRLPFLGELVFSSKTDN